MTRQLFTPGALVRASICSVFPVLGGALPAQPLNDAFRAREPISSLPFVRTAGSVASATNEADDPTVVCRVLGEGAGSHTLWYSLITGDDPQYVNISTEGSSYDTLLAVWAGSRGALKLADGGCSDNGSTGTPRSLIVGLRLAPRTEYIVEVAHAGSAGLAAASLHLEVSAAPLYVVTRTDDVFDGVCDGDCSLRDAVAASNAAPGAVLLGTAGYKLELPGIEDDNAAGDLDVRAGIAIYGEGAQATVIDAGGLDRVIDFPAGASEGGLTAHLHGLQLTGGDSAGPGGALSMAASGGFVALEDVVVRDSRSGGSGGGLYLTGSSVARRVSVSGNRAHGIGGGVAYVGGGALALHELYESTVNGNVAQGGSIGGGGISAWARVRLEHVTLSGNDTASMGGGLAVASGGTVAVRGATIARNHAALGGGGVWLASGTLHIDTSLLADNTYAAQVVNDCQRTTSSGWSLLSSYNHVVAPWNCLFAGAGDLNGVEALVDPVLRDNGGPTLTHALLPGSRAVDAGPSSGCIGVHGRLLHFDQRGAARTVDGDGFGGAVCDKGAVEYAATAPE